MNIPKEKELYFHKIILNIIKISEEFKLILQSEFPNIDGDIESTLTNSECSCTTRVLNELLQNKEKSLNILNKFIENKNNKEIEEIINIDYASLEQEYIYGKMFTIDNTPENYFKFIQENIILPKVYFRSFSTSIGLDGKLNIYFI